MSYWILKTDSDVYPFEQLEKDRQTTWDGVSNAVALKHIRTMHAVVARFDGRVVGCGQVALDDGLAAIYDMVTATDFRGRGLATAIVAALSSRAAQAGASHAFLQVNDDNAPALAVYRKYGFATLYAYYYRARPSECF